uniref:Cytochrome c biogenesis protein CcsA n=1 Tax=Cosmarium botrytis TaxID=33101 RepID=A0A191T590_9VIRI|nr:heme attachment to plastid cytochrome c [Cosmarium botrytis]ANI25560.1 heme attachment to plastid cytochrome c [Cosmarium botrytis]
MIFNTLEQIFIQFSFIIFFLVTLFSWVKITLYENKTISSAVAGAGARGPTLGGSAKLSSCPPPPKSRRTLRASPNGPSAEGAQRNNSEKIFSLSNPYGSFIGIFLGFLSVTGLCIIRWNLSDHIPLSNLYESSLFLAWSLIFLYLLFKIKIESEWLDAIIAPILLMTTTFSTLGLPKQLQEATALVPALQSNWLMMHVTMMILSYGALLFGSLLAVTLLTLNILSSEKNNSATHLFSNPAYVSERIDELSKTKYSLNSIQKTKNKVQKTGGRAISLNQSFSQKKTNQEEIQKTKMILNPAIAVPFSHCIDSKWNIENSELLKALYLQKYKTVLVNQIDYWSYRIIGIGFPLLTLGILSGAVWANEAWGSYWNWDPKETWALITWVIFAIYLHIRITKGWNGTKPALVAFLGFFVVWMCYLGVNLLGKGLHSYGWLN